MERKEDANKHTWDSPACAKSDGFAKARVRVGLLQLPRDVDSHQLLGSGRERGRPMMSGGAVVFFRAHLTRFMASLSPENSSSIHTPDPSAEGGKCSRMTSGVSSKRCSSGSLAHIMSPLRICNGQPGKAKKRASGPFLDFTWKEGRADRTRDIPHLTRDGGPNTHHGARTQGAYAHRQAPYKHTHTHT